MTWSSVSGKVENDRPLDKSVIPSQSLPARRSEITPTYFVGGSAEWLWEEGETIPGALITALLTIGLCVRRAVSQLVRSGFVTAGIVRFRFVMKCDVAHRVV